MQLLCAFITIGGARAQIGSADRYRRRKRIGSNPAITGAADGAPGACLLACAQCGSRLVAMRALPVLAEPSSKHERSGGTLGGGCVASGARRSQMGVRRGPAALGSQRVRAPYGTVCVLLCTRAICWPFGPSMPIASAPGIVMATSIRQRGPQVPYQTVLRRMPGASPRQSRATVQAHSTCASSKAPRATAGAAYWPFLGGPGRAGVCARPCKEPVARARTQEEGGSPGALHLQRCRRGLAMDSRPQLHADACHSRQAQSRHTIASSALAWSLPQHSQQSNATEKPHCHRARSSEVKTRCWRPRRGCCQLWDANVNRAAAQQTGRRLRASCAYRSLHEAARRGRPGATEGRSAV